MFLENLKITFLGDLDDNSQMEENVRHDAVSHIKTATDSLTGSDARFATFHGKPFHRLHFDNGATADASRAEKKMHNACPFL